MRPDMAKDTSEFPKDAVSFLKKLSKNNDKDWFEANRESFETDLFKPAQEFVKTLGAELQKIRPGIQAIPKTDKSIFRLHRDVRFSKDKSPYKTNLGILLWEGSRKKMENSGLYVHLEPGAVMAGLGMHVFQKDQLELFRNAVCDQAMQKELVTAVSKVTKKGHDIVGEHYKQIPRGFDKDMPNAELLLYNRLHAWHSSKDLKPILDGNMVKYCVKLFKEMLPVHEWLINVMENK
jgi:uncharacterized protein (TIGR02453 family)